MKYTVDIIYNNLKGTQWISYCPHEVAIMNSDRIN